MISAIFQISSRVNNSGIYVLSDYTGQIAYVGMTNSIYERLKSFSTIFRYELNDISDVYIIDMDLNDARAIEKVLIGILKPFLNERTYKYYELWGKLINDEDNEKLSKLLESYGLKLSNEETLIEYLSKLKYKTFAKRYLPDGCAICPVYPDDEWYLMTDNSCGMSEPLKNIINRALDSI